MIHSISLSAGYSNLVRIILVTTSTYPLAPAHTILCMYILYSVMFNIVPYLSKYNATNAHPQSMLL